MPDPCRGEQFSAIAGLAWPQGGSETILLRDEPRGYAPAADLVRRSGTRVKGRASTRSRGADEPSRHDRRTVLGAAVVALFLVGLACRLVIFARPHVEGDELIYGALVENLDAGRGYTLQGHPILQKPFVVKETYGRPLFFHPPGGIGLFWLLHRLFGQAGFSLVQLLSYAIFFWAMMLFAAAVLDPISRLQAILTAALASFTPIMTHVTSRFWLDGPLLAFSTAGAALFLMGIGEKTLIWACLAGVLLGYAALIKPTAILIAPGLLGLARAIGCRESGRQFGAPRSGRSLFFQGVCLLTITVCILAPWEIYQWTVMGNPFAVSPGRPAARLLAFNPYVHYVTVERSPWVYLNLLPRVLWTLVPALLLLVFQWNQAAVRRKGPALAGWIAVPLAAHIGLGFAGYSKLLRYLILVTPATVLLFTLVAANAWESFRAGGFLPGGKAWTRVLLFAAMAGLVSLPWSRKQEPVLDPAALILPLGYKP